MTSTGEWIRCSAQAPCPVCESDGWCQVSADGAVVQCMRNGQGAFESREIAGGAMAHFHRIGEKADSARPVLAVPSSKIADPDTRHAVYTKLLALLRLEDHHRADLERRKAPGPFGQRGYRTLPKAGRARLVKLLRDLFSDETLLSVPGIIVKTGENEQRYLTIAGSPGMLIPVRDEAGRIVAMKLRVDDLTEGGKYRWLSSSAHDGPSPSTPAHCPMGIKGPIDTVRIAEGPLKADIAASRNCCKTIAADSASNWRSAVDLVQRLGATTARLAFDGDWQDNERVAAGILACARALADVGVTVEFERWPAEHKGIDDALAAGYETEVVAGQAAEQFLEQLRQKCGKGKAQASQIAMLTIQDLTDLGNAKRFVQENSGDARFCHPWAKWLVWDGSCWRIDETGEVVRRMKASILRLFQRAEVGVDELRAPLLKFAQKSCGTERIRAGLYLAQSEPGIPVLPGELDQDPWLLNCANGTLDLRTAELYSPRRGDLITKRCPTPFDRTATAQIWDRTISAVFGESDELIRFFQRFFGYSLTGDVSEQVLLLAHGNGANGKTTAINAVIETMGHDYSIRAHRDLLLVRKQSGHSTERMDLYGKRLVVCSETNDGNRFDESLVKDLTGGESIRGRRMREDSWEYRPTHKIILATNHRPQISGTDLGIWRRLRLLPFSVTFEGAQDDKDLPVKLRGEAPGILAFAVRGCLDWRVNRLGCPDAVQAATAEYRESQDVLAGFVADCCVTGPHYRIKAGSLYDAYKRWCDRTGETAHVQRRFGLAMTERGFKRLTNNGIWYVGLALLDSDETRTEGTE